MARVNNIWSNAFKSGGEISGTILKNGIKNRVALSSINTTGVSTIAYSYTAAIMALVQGRVAVGITEDGNFFCEGKSSEHPNITYLAEYNPSKMLKVTVMRDRAIDDSRFLVSDSYAHWMVFVPRIAQIVYEDPSGEFEENYKEIFDEHEREKVVKSGSSIFVLNDYLYESQHEYILTNEEVGPLFDISPNIVEDLTEKFTGKLGAFSYGQKIGEVEETKPAKEAKSTKIKERKEKKVKREVEVFPLEWDREPTEEEKVLIPELDFDIIQVPERLSRLCAMVKEEISSLKPIKNILLYGEAGAGKSTGAKIVAQLLGLPYRFMSCSLNVEESEFIGTYKPNGEGGFDFETTAFAETVMNGGVIEVQEPTTLKSGVGVALNSVMDDVSQIVLGDGSIVDRHKNCIIIFTTNLDYAGCNRMNESVKDRFSRMVHVEKPSNKELIERTIIQSGNTNRALVTKLVDAVQKMAIKISEEEITGGVCSVRQLINWAQDIKYSKDPIKSAWDTVLPGVSLELEIQEEIVSTILKPLF